ncbi:hypothetical protein GINT2_001272 [Glugoides intestinalis]
MKIIAQGAEAIIYLDGDMIVKERLSKDYRIPEIDKKLIKSRTKREAKILQRLQDSDIRVPNFIKVEENKLYMEKINGIPLKNVLASDNAEHLMIKAGEIVAKIHKIGIVHGDLTTMNFLVTGGDRLVLIDFGLSMFTSKDEDKAVDLYVFERALKCGHSEEYADSFYKGYSSFGTVEVLKRLESVRLRGRKRESELSM